MLVLQLPTREFFFLKPKINSNYDLMQIVNKKSRGFVKPLHFYIQVVTKP